MNEIIVAVDAGDQTERAPTGKLRSSTPVA